MGVNIYKRKVVVAGNIVEIYEYDNPILEGFENKNTKGCGRSLEAEKEEKQKNRELVLYRAKRDVRRLINANVDKYGELSKFLTLTFREHVVTFKEANYEWKKFRQRLEDYLKIDLCFVVVPEFTKIGRIHYHAIFFNLPYILHKKITEIWGNGWVYINKIDKVDNVGAYVCKYMTKSENEKLKEKKCYFSSRKLYKPKEVKEKSKVDSLVAALPALSLTYENIYKSEFNIVNYKQYNLKKQ